MKKVIIIILVVATASLGAYFFLDQDNKEQEEINNFSLKLYKSRGSRDTSREEMYSFQKQDPIQVSVEFGDVGDVSNVVLEIVREGDVGPLQQVEIPIHDKNGQRFVSVQRILQEGKYTITLFESGEKKEITNVEFNIE